MLATGTVVGVIVLAVLVWLYIRTRSQDMLEEMMQKRRGASRLVTRAEYVEAMAKMPVALSLTDKEFFYENTDLQASFELARVDEIEYDNEMQTGHSVPDGTQVMRLRSHGAAFEFLMPQADIAKWQAVLPSTRSGHAAMKVGA